MNGKKTKLKRKSNLSFFYMSIKIIDVRRRDKKIENPNLLINLKEIFTHNWKEIKK